MQTNEIQELLFDTIPAWHYWFARPFKRMLNDGVSLDMYYCIQSMRRNGDKTIRVESADACAVSHLDASAQILTVESTVDGKTSTVSFPFSPPEGSKPPSYYKLIAEGAKPTSYRLIARHSSFIFS